MPAADPTPVYAPARVMVCIVHGPIPVNEARQLKAGKFKCPAEGCGRFLGKGVRESLPGPVENAAMVVRPPEGWSAAFRRQELQVRVEMTVARLHDLGSKVKSSSELLSAMDLFRALTAYRHGTWLLENSSAIPLVNGEEALAFFEREAAAALRIPALFEERASLAAKVMGLQKTATSLQKEITLMRDWIERAKAEEGRLSSEFHKVQSRTGMGRDEVLNGLRGFERLRSETATLSGIVRSLHSERQARLFELYQLGAHIQQATAQLRRLEQVKRLNVQELTARLTVQEANEIWSRVHRRRWGLEP